MQPERRRVERNTRTVGQRKQGLQPWRTQKYWLTQEPVSGCVAAQEHDMRVESIKHVSRRKVTPVGVTKASKRATTQAPASLQESVTWQVKSWDKSTRVMCITTGTVKDHTSAETCQVMQQAWMSTSQHWWTAQPWPWYTVVDYMQTNNVPQAKPHWKTPPLWLPPCAIHKETRSLFLSSVEPTPSQHQPAQRNCHHPEVTI